LNCPSWTSNDWNFQVLDLLDFLAEFTQHIPPKGAHLIRYYGWYSNKSRGMRRKAEEQKAKAAGNIHSPVSTPSRCSQTWAMLIKRVYEVDPLACPKCGGQMKVVAFIEPPQGALIEKILRHCGLWRPSIPRPPPPVDWGLSEFAPSPFGKGTGSEGDGSLDWSDLDGFYDLSEDFAQAAPDDSAYYADLGIYEATF